MSTVSGLDLILPHFVHAKLQWNTGDFEWCINKRILVSGLHSTINKTDQKSVVSYSPLGSIRKVIHNHTFPQTITTLAVAYLKLDWSELFTVTSWGRLECISQWVPRSRVSTFPRPEVHLLWSTSQTCYMGKTKNSIIWHPLLTISNSTLSWNHNCTYISMAIKDVGPCNGICICTIYATYCSPTI